MGDLRIFLEFRIFFTFVEKKTLSPASWLFLSGKKWRNDATLLQTCQSSRFNPDIPIFQYKSRSRSILIPRVKIPVFFCFVSKLEKNNKASHVVACPQKAHKVWAKNKFMIGWIDGLGWFLCTLRLSEWSRLGLASLSPRPLLCATLPPIRGIPLFF